MKSSMILTPFSIFSFATHTTEPSEMTTRENQSYAAVSSHAGEAEKLFSKAIKDTEADRKAEAKKVSRDELLLHLFLV